MTVRNSRADGFVDAVGDGNGQELTWRLTGNENRGNEPDPQRSPAISASRGARCRHQRTLERPYHRIFTSGLGTSEERRWKTARRKQPLTRVYVERMTGIEPAYSAWEADVLPLNYIREDC